MRVNAKRHGKTVPTYEQLHEMLRSDMKCRDCPIIMNWLSGEGLTTVMTLQHYRNGTFGLVCKGCNTRHGSMPDDLYLSISSEEKWCPGCKKVKNLAEFFKDNSKKLKRYKVRARCKGCCEVQRTKWRKNNKERVNATAKKWRDKQKHL